LTSGLRARLWRWWHRRSSAPADDTSAPVVHDVTQTHDEVSHYWTDERMREARAREQQLPLPEEPRRD
jgi:hypothetical protein